MHQQTVQLNPHCEIEERTIEDHNTGDTFVGLSVQNGASTVELPKTQTAPFVELAESNRPEAFNGLHFVPYYFRANREGRGQMRVGLRKLASGGG